MNVTEIHHLTTCTASFYCLQNVCAQDSEFATGAHVCFINHKSEVHHFQAPFWADIYKWGPRLVTKSTATCIHGPWRMGSGVSFPTERWWWDLVVAQREWEWTHWRLGPHGATSISGWGYKGWENWRGMSGFQKPPMHFVSKQYCNVVVKRYFKNYNFLKSIFCCKITQFTKTAAFYQNFPAFCCVTCKLEIFI